jgi:colanic acid/amylovoran biosynthesis glycosyltransferase
MKIAHVRDQYLGVSFIYFLLIGFRRHENYLICREILKGDVVKYPYDKIKVTNPWFQFLWFLEKALIRLFGNKKRIVNSWFLYYRLIKSMGDIKLVHAHMGPQGFYALPLVNKLNLPLIVTFYGSDMSDIPRIKGWQENYRKLFARVNAVVVEGPYMKNKMVHLGCPSDKVRVIKIGVPLNHLTFQYRPKYNVSEGLNILMCSNFYPKKGIFKALNAFKYLSDKGFKFNVKIIGDGPLRKKISERIIELDLTKKVALLGQKTLAEIYDISKDYHVFLHPSETAVDGASEGGAPTIIIEMQALGLPIIATRHADIPNIIPRDNHQYLSSEYDALELAENIINFSNAKNWNDISLKGRNYVIKEHDSQDCSAQMESLYDSIIYSFCKLS